MLSAVWLVASVLCGCEQVSSRWTSGDFWPKNSQSATASAPVEATPAQPPSPENAASRALIASRKKRAAEKSQGAAQKPSAASSEAGTAQPQLEDANSTATGAGFPAAGTGPSAPPTAKPGLAPTAKPTTIALGESPEASESARSARLSSGAGSDTANEPIQVKAERMIREVTRIAKQIDLKNLSANDSKRYVLAEKLIGNAEKTRADHDFAAAASLANKASDLLAPLPRLAEPIPAKR